MCNNNIIIMFTLLDSFTILLSSIILVSPIFIIIFILKNGIPIYYSVLMQKINHISTIIKIILIDKYILNKLFNNGVIDIKKREHRKLITKENILKEINNNCEALEEDDIHFVKRDIERMNDDELYNYLSDLKYTREIVSNKAIIIEVTSRLPKYIWKYFGDQTLMGEKIDFRELESIMSEKIRQMDPVITDISEMFTERNMSPIGRLLFSILSTSMINHIYNKYKRTKED